MQYEIYIDSLFLLDFAMNLYLLLLVNRSLNHTATWKRLLAGAAFGGAGYCLMFFLPFSYVPVKILFVGIPVNAGVLYVTFLPHSFALFKKLFMQMTGYAFLFGGAFFALLHLLPFLKIHVWYGRHPTHRCCFMHVFCIPGGGKGTEGGFLCKG